MTGHSTNKTINTSSPRKFLVIGNGIAGVTCARHIRKNDAHSEITIVSGETDHFFSRTALMYIYMGHMKYEHTKPYEDWFWGKNRINLKRGWIEKVDFDKKNVVFETGELENYDVLILATGSKPNAFGWPGQDLSGVQGLYSYQDLELMEANTKEIFRAVIVGGGLIGIEMAEMLASREIPVTFLVREKSFWDNILPQDEAKLINKHIREHHIDLRLETELEEIIGDGNGKVKAVKTKSGENIDCQFVGLAVGVSPNIDFLKKTDLDTKRGILVDEYFRTNIDDVYAIGDCVEFRKAPGDGRKNIEQVWYTGRMHGETLAQTLTNIPTVYRPGIWFNSAKFLDIEYQTYGFVPNEWDESFESFYWEDHSGKICLRLLYKKESLSLIGVNALGWRLRHEFFDTAIAEDWKVEKVLVNLHRANFNPEFFKPVHKKVIDAYNNQHGKSISLSKLSFFKKLIGSKA